MKIKLLIILLLVINIKIFSQENNVTGRVVDNYGNAVWDANVFLKESKKGVKTDQEGNFTINNIKGNYTLQISFIGFKTKELKITAPTNLSDIVLYEGNEILQEVLVDGKVNKFSRKKTAYVSKLPLKDLENTQVYTTVTSELLKSQVVTDLDQAMVNATGVYKLWESTGRSASVGSTFFTSRGFSVQPRLIDGVAGISFGAGDPSFIERIEVIKGPSATLFGSTETSIGGLINVVTKKPYEGKGGEISYTGGSFGFNRASLDYNTSLDKSGKAFFRINSSYLSKKSFQDAGFKKTFFIAPSLSLRVNNRLNISAGIEYSDTKQTNPSMLFLRRGSPLIATNIEELNIDPTKSYTSDDIYLKNQVFNTRAIADYKLSDNWSSKTVFSSSYTETKGDYQYQFDGGALGLLQLNSVYDQLDAVAAADASGQTRFALDNFVLPAISPLIDGMTAEAFGLFSQEAFTRIFSRRDSDETRYNLQQNFIGDFKIGKVRNRLVFGLDYVNNSRNNANVNGNPLLLQSANFPELFGTLEALGLSNVSDGIVSAFAAFPYFDAFVRPDGSVIPNSFTPNASTEIDNEQVDAVFSQLDPFLNSTKSQTLAAYVSDVVNITPKLSVNLALRLDQFIQDGRLDIENDGYIKTTFSPTFGILYQPIKDKVTVFGNYQTGFENVDPTVNGDGSVSVFQPQEAKQFEVGVKTNLFNGRLNLGASYYDITVKNFVDLDPRGQLFTNSIDFGEVVSKGFEFELNASPFNGLNIRGSYSFNDTKHTDVSSIIGGDTYTELLNRRPSQAGPETLYNFWADYRFQEASFLKNFGLGFGFNGASEHLTINDAVGGTFTLPSYTIFNASAYYDAKKFRIGVKANNFTDKQYYTGWTTVNAQETRAFLASVTYKF